GANVLVRRINRKMFFGFDLIKYYEHWLPVSDIEKTLVDFFYFKEPLSKETLEEIKQKLEKKKLNQYLKKCSPALGKKIKKAINLQ
ncbi:MAG: hypothetical protein Q8N60_00180, partial [Candidatus Diapherotrites archaeon]|nr:hypothetical protein [Candidatus Diapherotrites archaeon]